MMILRRILILAWLLNLMCSGVLCASKYFVTSRPITTYYLLLRVSRHYAALCVIKNV